MKTPSAAALACLALALPCAHAGRPLGTDDAGTAAEHTCQVEAWYAHQGTDTTAVLAPACALADGLELDLGLALPAQRREVLLGASLALKWVPAAWAIDTAWGKLNLGLKLGADATHLAGTGWQHADTTGLLLASWVPNDAWAVHANLGRGEWRPAGAPRLQATLYNLAATWAPCEPALLFAEWQGNSRQADVGPAWRTAGGRWWLQKDRLGLDLTLGRPSGPGARTQISLGFGWYGLAF
jgi:hypothetical protein